MTQRPRLDDLFLRIFKSVILLLMSLCLLGTLAFLGLGGWQYAQKPRDPEPARKPPAATVGVQEFKASLEKSPPSAPSARQELAASPQAPKRLYVEDAARLKTCVAENARLAGVVLDPAVLDDRIEGIRAQTQRLADQPRRGADWVRSVFDSTCQALRDPVVAAMQKDGRLDDALYEALNYYLTRWDAIAQERAEFEESEQRRVAREISAEEARIAEAKALALQCAVAAGVAFAAFMALALYLILAKIETNLRDVGAALRSGGGR